MTAASKGRAQSGVAAGAITFHRVTKRYGRSSNGVFDLDLTIAGGQVFGFLGPNGAGKTTTIRLMLDLIRPNSGRITMAGLDSRRDSVELHRRVGYVPGDLALYERLTARELLSHFAALRSGPQWAEIVSLVERFDLVANVPIGSLSKGNKQKVGLVQAFMGQPDILLLDEPTSGLDPIAQKEVHDLLRERVHDGATVFLSSHVLSEVAAVADTVGIIRSGRLITVDDIAGLRSRAVHRLEAHFAELLPADAFADTPGVTRVEIDRDVARMELVGDMDAVVKAIALRPLVELVVREPSLEEVFLSFYGSEP
jgi:ABC-2 type transport system ATP-binding protein